MRQWIILLIDILYRLERGMRLHSCGLIYGAHRIFCFMAGSLGAPHSAIALIARFYTTSRGFESFRTRCIPRHSYSLRTQNKRVRFCSKLNPAGHEQCGATHPLRRERLGKSSSYTTSWTAVLTAYTVIHSSHPSSVSVI